MQQVLLSERQYHFIFLYNVMAFVMYFPNVLPFVFDGDFVVFSSLSLPLACFFIEMKDWALAGDGKCGEPFLVCMCNHIVLCL